MRSWPSVTLGVSAALACLTSCGSTSPEPLGPESSILIVLEPSEATLARGGAVQLIVTPKGAATKLSGSEIDWITSNPKVASVEPSGIVRALQPGSASITASWHGTYAVAAVTVVDKRTGSCPMLSLRRVANSAKESDRCE